VDQEDESMNHYPNILNPLTWVVLIVWGLAEGIARWYLFIHYVVRDAVAVERARNKPKETAKTAKLG
jgi:hypothetical protein